jgi:hypothetical protein
MSILSDAWRGKTTWGTALTRIGTFVQKLGAGDAVASQFLADANSAVKQGLSDAIGLADTELGQHFGELVDVTSTAADAALLKLTGGVALPAIPIMNGTIQQIAKAGKAGFDAWALEAQAKLNAPNTQAPNTAQNFGSINAPTAAAINPQPGG